MWQITNLKANGYEEVFFFLIVSLSTLLICGCGNSGDEIDPDSPGPGYTKAKCTLCNASGKCYDCNSGSDGGSSSASNKRCPLCFGSGTCSSRGADWRYCHGSGKCQVCNGTGINSSDVGCNYCASPGNGSRAGNGVCGYCGGSGRCKKCGGSGKI